MVGKFINQQLYKITMKTLKRVVKAAAAALLLSQGSCYSGYSVPLSVSLEQPAPQKETADIIDCFKENYCWRIMESTFN